MGALIAGVLSAVVVTSLISGVIGMAGGMILMGLLMVLLPVETAMIFHGVTQLAANGSRAFFYRRHLRLGVLPPYLLGASLCLTLFFGVSYRASEGVVCLVLGALPYLGLILPRAPGLDIAHRPGLLSPDLAPRWFLVSCSVYDLVVGALCYLPIFRR